MKFLPNVLALSALLFTLAGCEPPITPVADGGAACVVGGCSGQLCVAPGDDAVTTCEWRDEYACYQTAECTLQANGECGWTESDELMECLASASEPSEPSVPPPVDVPPSDDGDDDEPSDETGGPKGDDQDPGDETGDWKGDDDTGAPSTGSDEDPAPPDDPIPGEDPKDPSECVRGGCSGQLCVAADADPIFTTCEWRDEYACYDTATCEKQTNGGCGWTLTDDLATCLKSGGAASE